ncbi:MAG: hypothetical protein COA36_15610 [Desulfotalea sp.]|nr:MAG: hypothetical protein COA36_15610 [Desulfotalea sp.]
MKINLYYKNSPLPGLKALSCANDFAFDKHIHSGHVLWLNSKGGEIFTLQQTATLLQPGSISIIEPGVVHSNRPATANRRHLRSLYLEQDFFQYLETLVTGTTTQEYELATRVFDNRMYWRGALTLHEAIISGQDRLLIEELTLSFFPQIGAEQFADLNTAARYDHRIVTLIEFMVAHIATDLSLQILATIAGCTSYHVIRLFKNAVGMSPHAYLIQIRLERARQLIDRGESIADAALTSGFSDQSHLSRRFKKRYGITPGTYASQQAA